MRMTMTLLSVLALSVPGVASAADTGPRDILDIGCHLFDNTCYVTVSGDAVGPASCRTNSIRWNSQSSPGGKNALSLLTAAFLAGKKVNFSVPDTSCYADQPFQPTFSYFAVVR